MSVIAKMYIYSVQKFGTGNLVTLSCVGDNDMMAAYATSEEDKLFSRYSPSGQISLSTPEYTHIGQAADHQHGRDGDRFYVMMLAKDEVGEIGIADRAFPGASLWMEGLCYAVTDYGGTKEVQFTAQKQEHRGVDRLAWRMMVDNPRASDQFKAGEACWIVFYPAASFTRDTAIAAAHGRP